MSRRHAIEDPAAQAWSGPKRHYDIVKEGVLALLVVTLLTVVLAAVFSSPDVPPVTVHAWAQAQPAEFASTALSELDGTSTSASYGPPYNDGTGSVQAVGPLAPQRWFGVRTPVDAAQAFVLQPLASLPQTPALAAALHRFSSATAAQRAAWEHAYAAALHTGRVPSSWPGAGPVAEMLSSLTTMARSGALDAQLLAHDGFYTTDYTKPILFLGDSAAADPSSYWSDRVSQEHLLGTQWGMMNETGNWPGQPWLWLYTAWYQLPPASTSTNGDLLVVIFMTVLSAALLLLPFIPGLRDIPRLIPVHRLIWRSYTRGTR